jgi:N-acetylneuraminic acid mutarotase
MQSMNLFQKILILLFGVAICVQAVPPVLNYAGQVAVNGEAFDGNGLFKFALVNADGTTTYWSNDGTSVEGSEPQASVAVPVNGGLYAVLLGNTAQQGMGAIDPALFAQHTDAKLRVWFSDGVNGFQQLSPDRPFASVPYAFNSKSADTANVATTAMAVQEGAVTSSMLASNAVTSDKLSPQIKADINATIGMNRLSTEVTEKLNQEKTTTNYNAPSVGSLLAVPSGSDAPAGYSLYQQGEPKELVWEEKAPVSVARWAFDGVVELGGKIYFVGGYNGSGMDLVESYDPSTNNWLTLQPMSQARYGPSCSVLDGKIYAIGGFGLSTVEIYDPLTNIWTSGPQLPQATGFAGSITVGNTIYLVGGKNGNGTTRINQVLCFDKDSNSWVTKASLPIAMDGTKLVYFEDKIWAIGGYPGSSTRNVFSYDLTANLWQTEDQMVTGRSFSAVWINSGFIFSAGSYNPWSNSVEYYNPNLKIWKHLSSLPQNIGVCDAVTLNNKVYILGGSDGSTYSKKVFAADLNASMEGVYDLYRKDGDAPVGTPVVQSEYADGSVTTSKLDATILKYLKPEITSQPQASTIYAGVNATFSVTAEGKYLTFQWKKDGVDLAGETIATLNITDANATLHDGNYSVVVSNDFGSVDSGAKTLIVLNTEMDGLVGWWKFDEGSGTVAYDSSGNGNDGNLMGGPTWTTGKIGGALKFDGVNKYVDVGNSSMLNPSDSMSITCWFLPSEISDYGHGTPIVTRYVAGSDYSRKSYVLKFSSLGKPEYYLYNGSSPYASAKTQMVLLTDQYYFIAVAFSTLGGSMYLNNIKVAELNLGELTSIMQSSVSTRIGSWGHNDWPEFKGLIDDVRIYDRALSAGEVQALYNLGQ